MKALRSKPAPSARRGSLAIADAAEERALMRFNRLAAKAAPRAARETAAALARFHRDIALAISRAG